MAVNKREYAMFSSVQVDLNMPRNQLKKIVLDLFSGQNSRNITHLSQKSHPTLY